MVDNSTVKDASGAIVTVASDEIDGVNYQRVKLVAGADGLATDVSAAAGLPVQETPFARGSNTHGTYTSLAVAVTLTTPAGATKLLVQALGANVRYRLDGANPTATTGFRLYDGDTATITIGTGTAVRVIQETAGGSIEYQFGS